MWQDQLDDSKSFVNWYLEHYYKVDGEEMDVEKDLFWNGSGTYHIDFCCILPKRLNIMLANAKKYYKEGETPDNLFPLGVRYSGNTGKYFSDITFIGAQREYDYLNGIWRKKHLRNKR